MDVSRPSVRSSVRVSKAPLGAFLKRNPFNQPLSLGFFYREKMRAIHSFAPVAVDRALDIGGGRSGLLSLLYPRALIVVADRDVNHASASCNSGENVSFLATDATSLPFEDSGFSLVTMFDVLEHVAEDTRLAAEAWRVLRPDGWLLVTTPKDTWQYPHFSISRPIARGEAELMAEWGHVRRGYGQKDLERLFGRAPDRLGSFMHPLAALGHDISFSRLGETPRFALWLLSSPLTLFGYVLGRSLSEGSEWVAAWHKK